MDSLVHDARGSHWRWHSPARLQTWAQQGRIGTIIKISSLSLAIKHPVGYVSWWSNKECLSQHSCCRVQRPCTPLCSFGQALTSLATASFTWAKLFKRMKPLPAPYRLCPAFIISVTPQLQSFTAIKPILYRPEPICLTRQEPCEHLRVASIHGSTATKSLYSLSNFWQICWCPQVRFKLLTSKKAKVGPNVQKLERYIPNFTKLELCCNNNGFPDGDHAVPNFLLNLSDPHSQSPNHGLLGYSHSPTVEVKFQEKASCSGSLSSLPI